MAKNIQEQLQQLEREFVNSSETLAQCKDKVNTSQADLIVAQETTFRIFRSYMMQKEKYWLATTSNLQGALQAKEKEIETLRGQLGTLLSDSKSQEETPLEESQDNLA